MGAGIARPGTYRLLLYGQLRTIKLVYLGNLLLSLRLLTRPESKKRRSGIRIAHSLHPQWILMRMDEKIGLV